MALEGKGFFIWQIRNCEGGSASTIASLADQANFTHILIKVADGTYSYNVNTNGVDLVSPVAQALRDRGVQVWGWHYIYGDSPLDEANKAIQRIRQINLQGYAIDVEGEYKDPGKASAAMQFMNRLRSAYPNLPIALCSYRYPSYHPQIPWEEFLSQCNYNMPQVYWVSAHNPADQLRRSVSEFQSMSPYRPIIPVGSAYKSGSWSASVSDVNEFLRTAQSLNLNGANFWEWSNCRLYLPSVWGAIRDYNWGAPTPPPPPPPVDIAVQLVDRLNTHDPAQAAGLYTPAGVHVTAARTVQGITAIQSWYRTLLTELIPDAAFTLVSYTGSGSSRHLTWTAASGSAQINNGNDTLGLLDGKIAYHFSSFSVTRTR